MDMSSNATTFSAVVTTNCSVSDEEVALVHVEGWPVGDVTGRRDFLVAGVTGWEDVRNESCLQPPSSSSRLDDETIWRIQEAAALAHLRHAPPRRPLRCRGPDRQVAAFLLEVFKKREKRQEMPLMDLYLDEENDRSSQILSLEHKLEALKLSLAESEREREALKHHLERTSQGERKTRERFEDDVCSTRKVCIQHPPKVK